MILEGVVTTIDAAGRVHVAPMGPEVDASMRRIVLRPFPTSTTYENLRRHPEGVFHVTDDVELIARSAVGIPEHLPEVVPAESVRGWILAGACRWYAFRALRWDASQPRVRIEAETIDSGRLRDFFGLNRAKHAVVEAAILASRCGILPADDIRRQIQQLAPLVEKTGGPPEARAFAFLCDHIDAALRGE